MAERVVAVKLSAQVAEYKRGMEEAARATRSVGSEGEKLTQTRQAMETLGRTGVVAGGLLAAGIGVAIAAYAQFDQAMSYVIATGEDAAASQDALRQAALDAGASTVFSATESANAIEELARAGISAKDILGGGLTASLDLAAAGGLGVAEAAGIAATTMQQFKLRGEDASRVADLLAAGAGKAMGDVRDMSEALKQSGLVADQFGLSVEETTGTLAAFANAGLLGSDAGTSFRTMLLRLANPTDEVKTLMADVGIEAYNAQGQFIGLSALAGELETSLSGMTDAQKQQTLAMIFGQDAIRASTILLDEGQAGIEGWTAAVDDQGYAAETAATRLDNLLGDLEAFTGALETAFIQMGAGADGPLRALIQGLTGLVEGFTELPPWVQQGTLALAGVLAAVALVGGAALLAVPKIVEFRLAMQTLGLTATSTKGALSSAAGFLGGPWGLAITAAVAAAAVWISTNQRMAASAAEFRDTLDDTSGAVTDYTRELIAKKLQEAGAFDGAREAGISQKELTDALYEGGDALDDVKDRLRDAHDSYLGFNPTIGNSINAVRELGVNLEDAKAGHENLKAATDGSTDATEDSAAATAANEEALSALAGQAGDTEADVNSLADAIRGFGSAQFDVRESSRQFESALDELTQSVTDNGASLDVAEQAGRDNEAALDAVAQSALDLAGSLYVTTGSQEEAAGAIQRGRDELIAALGQFGITGQAAEDYADKLGLIPSNIPTAVQLTGADEASEKLRLLRERLAGIPSYKSVTLETIELRSITGSGRTVSQVAGDANGAVYDYQQFADGGFASGIYAGRQGSIHKFAEPETIWEAYISGKPDARDRNIGIWQETGRRLGVESAPAAAMSFPDQVTLVDQDGSILAITKVQADSSAASTTAGFASARRGGLRR
jgi:TP901 family phage tail tape measure protein